LVELRALALSSTILKCWYKKKSEKEGQPIKVIPLFIYTISFSTIIFLSEPNNLTDYNYKYKIIRHIGAIPGSLLP
jgi:hypothetical protein